MRSFGVSSAHKGMWLAQKMSPDILNHALTLLDVDGELDAAAMESAFLHVLAEAEVLRVNFVEEQGTLRMVPRELGDWRPFFLDVSAEPDPEVAAREALAELIRRPFDLERDPLYRLGVVRLAAARSLVVIGYHHLISDGYGAGGLLARRLAEVYTALARGARVPEPPRLWDAESYAAEVSGYAGSQRFADDTEFWRDYLKDAPAPAQVPRVALSDATRSALSEPACGDDLWSPVAGAIGMASRTLAVPRAEADAWAEAAESMGVWTSSMLTAAAAVLFRHRCDLPEFLLSLAVANRTGAAAGTPGLAVNVVPMRVRVPLGATFAEVADAVVDETYKIFGHTGCHYSEIQRASGTVLTGRGSFGAVMNIVDFAEALRFDGRPARPFSATTGAFDELSIGVCAGGGPGGELLIRLDAPANLYSGAELRFIGEELIACVRAGVAADSRPVGALAPGDSSGKDRADDTTAQKAGASQEPEETPPELTVPELFGRQVERAPHAVAVVSGDSQVSYGELDERSDRLAGALRRRGVGPEAVVAVAMPRSADLVVALLGVVKAGGAYLPLDPASSAERIGSLVGGSPARALLADAVTARTLSALGVPLITFDDLSADSADDDWGGPVPARPEGLMAVMYGPGEAGAATGVGLTHGNVRRLAMEPRWRQAGADALWQVPSTSHALPLELWAPLLNGGRVVVAPPGEPDAAALAGLLASHGIAKMWLPADRFSLIAADRPGCLSGLREVWTGGDRVPAAAVRRVREACPGLAILTGHGPVEAGVFAASHRLAPDAPPYEAGTAGRPSEGAALHVLGPGLAPVPAGVVGELYVSGSGVARGYAGRPGRTAERFVACPFGPPGGLMYRTGDRVRWGPGGLLEHVGRTDLRARIHGVWVEPAEVEEVLSGHPGLARAVVVVREDGSAQPRLVAYAVPGGGAGAPAPLPEELRRFAAERLPEFMVPSSFVVLDCLPTTAGGSADRASLPEPEFEGGGYRPPRDDTERVLAEAFAEVLELDRVGIDDDFFDLGGNSLRAIRLVGLIRAELNFEVSIRTLFAVRTIAGLSDMRKDLARSSRPALRRRTRDGRVL